MQTINISPQYALSIPLGRRGENNARQIIFDCSGFEREYPCGTAQLLVQRHLDSVPYLPPVVREGDRVIWTLTAADTAKPGTGRAELRWYVNETLAKSRVLDTYTMPALGEPSEDIPEPDKSAVELLTDRVAGLQQSVDQLDEDARESIRRADETLDTASEAAAQAAIEYFKAHPLPAVCG